MSPVENPSRHVLVEILLRAVPPPALVFVFWFVMTFLLGLTSRIPGIDMVYHFLGGATFAWGAWRCLLILEKAGVIQRLERLVRSSLSFTATATAAVFWEFAEFTADSIWQTHFQRDNTDTMTDLLMGVSGAALAVIFLFSQRGRRREE